MGCWEGFHSLKDPTTETASAKGAHTRKETPHSVGTEPMDGIRDPRALELAS